MTNSWDNRKLGAVLWIAAAVAFFLLEAIAAAAVVPTYSYANNYISQLGVPEWSPLAAVMNLGFAVQGILFLIGAILLARESTARGRRLFIVLVAMTALGDVIVAIAHADPHIDPAVAFSWMAWWHWVGSLLAIPVGNAAIVAGSSIVARLVDVRGYRAVSIVLAVLGFLSLLTIGGSFGQRHPGLWERGSVYSILVWQIFSAVLLLTRARAANVRTIARQD